MQTGAGQLPEPVEENEKFGAKTGVVEGMTGVFSVHCLPQVAGCCLPEGPRGTGAGPLREPDVVPHRAPPGPRPHLRPAAAAAGADAGVASAVRASVAACDGDRALLLGLRRRGSVP